MYALGIGALLSYIILYKKKLLEIISKPIWLYLGFCFYSVILVLQFPVQLKWFREVGNEIVFALLSALVVLRASNNGFKYVMKYILENKFVVYSGKISYGLYVYHLFIPSLYYYIAPHIGLSISNMYTIFIAYFILAFIVSHISWILIEKPISKLKSQVPYIG